MPRVRVASTAVASTNFMNMVAALPAAKLDLLYDSHWTCQAVFRSLPPLAKQYVLRLLYVDMPVSAKLLQDWVVSEGVSKHRVAIDRLKQLRVFLMESERKKEESYKLNPKMQLHLRQAVIKGGGPPRDPLPPNIAVRVPTHGELEDYATKQWENIIFQLVNSTTSGSSSSSSNPIITKIFLGAGLMAARNSDAPRITEPGFQFLLLDRNSQLWQIIREYISSAEARKHDSGELIRFLLELGFHSVGEPYNMASLTPMQQQFAEELQVFGLLCLQKGMKDRWFIPTRLAAGLSASLSESADHQITEGFIMVETNFRVYAYTSSKIQISTLRLFIRIEYELPNVTVGSLTKESLNAAFTCGITADQIISYLQKHAHPHIGKRVPSVPETITDQIRLWENDRNRVMMDPVCFYENFPSLEFYEDVAAHARDLGGLLWENKAKRWLFVREDLHEEMRSFMQRRQQPSQKQQR